MAKKQGKPPRQNKIHIPKTRTAFCLPSRRRPTRFPAMETRPISGGSISGQNIRIKDIAKVTLREKDENFIVRNEGKRGMNLVVRKKSNADVINTIDNIKLYMEENSTLQNIGYSYSNDRSEKTRLRLQVLAGNAVVGFALVVIILMLALNTQAAFWAAMSVPFSLLGSFILLPYFGVILSSISLAGFVLVLGLLVDDAIVVTEKITHYREKGLSPKDAALKGTLAMWRPVLVASITTIIAFTPSRTFPINITELNKMISF